MLLKVRLSVYLKKKIPDTILTCANVAEVVEAFQRDTLTGLLYESYASFS